MFIVFLCGFSLLKHFFVTWDKSLFIINNNWSVSCKRTLVFNYCWLLGTSQVQAVDLPGLHNSLTSHGVDLEAVMCDWIMTISCFPFGYKISIKTWKRTEKEPHYFESRSFWPKTKSKTTLWMGAHMHVFVCACTRTQWYVCFLFHFCLTLMYTDSVCLSILYLQNCRVIDDDYDHAQCVQC